MVVAVFLGIRPTGGYGVEITAARREGGTLVVEYVERRPRPDALLTQALTAPFHIVALPRHDGAVTFRHVAPPLIR
jgi:PrcB C-terminal